METDGSLVLGVVLDKSDFEDEVEDLPKSSKLGSVISKISGKFKNMFKGVKGAFSEIGKSVSDIGKKILAVGGDLLKTIGKALLGVMGFGAGFMLAMGGIALLIAGLMIIAKAFSEVMEENQQLKTDIQYIVFAFKTALQPAIDAVKKVIVDIINYLIYIFKLVAMIINAIAGKNVFGKATAEAFAKSMKKADKSAKGVANSAKEAKKQLAGFDEMNVLNDTKASGGGGGGVSTPTIKPSFDFSNLEDAIKPAWIKKIEEHFDKIRTQWATTKGILKKDWEDLKTRISDWWTNLKTQWESFKVGFSNSWTDLKDKVIGHFEKLKTEWENFKLGLQASANEIKYTIVNKWQEIKDKIVGVVDSIKTKWNELKTKITEIITPIINKFNDMKNNISTAFNTIKEKATTIFTNIKTFITDKVVKPIQDKFSGLKSSCTTIFNGIKDALKGPLNTMIGWVNKLIDGLNKVSIKVPAWVNEMIGKGNKESKWGFNITKIPKLAKGGIINMPGRGTPIAYGGERGAEGVIPLTDSQQMELLGEAIGRYITINANITNSMNGRIISRELQKIQNENAFAGNR